MDAEVLPEVKEKEVEEQQRRQDARQKFAKQMAVRCTASLQLSAGRASLHLHIRVALRCSRCSRPMAWMHVNIMNRSSAASAVLQTGTIPKLSVILEDSDEEEEPDAIVVVPHKKVKLVVGPGGEKIKHIQHKSKCRLQVDLTCRCESAACVAVSV